MTETRDQSSAPADTPGRIFVPDFVTEANRGRILIAGILASAMGFIDGTIISIAIPSIRQTLGATLGQMIWVNLGYMVTLSALILVGGAFGDRFGLARVFRLGIGLFMATSLISAVAPSPEILIVARLAQGIGAALMVPGALAIISRTYPRDSRTRAISLWAGATSFVTAIGTVIGVVILTFGPETAWRAIFVLNLPLGLSALWLLAGAINKDTARPGEPVDLLGGGLATLGLGLLAWALASGEDGSGLSGTGPLAMILFGAALLGTFLFQQHVSREPMMPLGLFRNRTFSAANFVTFALYFALSAIMFYLPMLTIAGWGVSEVVMMLAFAPMSICMVLFSTRFGRLADHIGPGPVIAAGAAVVCAAMYWLSAAVAGQDFWTDVLPPMALTGLGMSMVVAPLSSSVMGAVIETRSGVASGVNNAVSRTAGLIAVAAMGTVAASAYTNAGGPRSYGLSLPDPAHAAAMTEAFAQIALICSVLSGLAALGAAIGIRLPR